MKPVINIMWFRRDLRLKDNAALYHALKSTHPVVPVFIFDRNILDDLEDKKDRRVEFIFDAIEEMQQKLLALKSTLDVHYGKPENVLEALFKKYTIEKIFANEDYEQYAIDRDQAINTLLKKNGAALHLYKDQVIFHKKEVLKDDEKPYTVFTPYSRRWKEKLNDFYLKSYPTEKYFDNFFQQQEIKIPSLESMGFERCAKPFPSKDIEKSLIKNYSEERNFPAQHGTSKLSVHLRFGTISIRELAAKTRNLSNIFLNELIWRDFYFSILFHFPHVRNEKAFKPEYDKIEWLNDEADFQKWCEGKTGYPLVDAGMRQLNETGFMHNRIRMVTASFLTKHLLTDWRWGEAYFAKKLLDYDYAANNGGWQWAAGSGCDAAPYFRIFNPTLQMQKFDKEQKYIKQWVPEFGTDKYPEPIVQHEFARKRALEAYSKAVKNI